MLTQGVPNVIVNVIPPSPLLNGVPTNIIGVVGTAIYGPVNSPQVAGSTQELINTFGAPQPALYDLGTQVYNAMVQGSNNFRCVRVTDGTDTNAESELLDMSAAVGVTLTARYTGTLANTVASVSGLQAVLTQGSSSSTYNLTISFIGGVPEVFSNIGGSGNAFWQNLANAVNFGQNNLRGASQLVTASVGNGIASVTVVNAGSYATLPTLGATLGSGAVLAPLMKAVSGVPAAIGTGYAPADTITLTGGTHAANSVLTVTNVKLATLAVNAGGSGYSVNDTVVLAGGTFSTAGIVTVASVDGGGAILTITISNRGAYTVRPSSFTQGSTSGVGSGATFNTPTWGVNAVTVTTPGSYSALPSSPVAQGSTSGAGSGATFTMLWGLLSVVVSAGGTGYTSASTFTVTGGGGSGGATGTLVLGGGASAAPDLGTYTFSGGTNGNSGVTDATLIGSDVSPRTGMYALRGTPASIGVLADQTDPTYWDEQVEFGLSEEIDMIGTMVKGSFSDLNASVGLKQNNLTDPNYEFKLQLGDWCLINDPFNGLQRYTSPQGFVAGLLGSISPNGSSLNKQMQGILATEKTAAKQVYSDADLQLLQTNGIDVITSPIPLSPNGNIFGVRLGVNTSPSILTNGDNYTRLTNFLSATFKTGLGNFIGLPQSPDVQRQARNTLQTFLQNLNSLQMIGAFRVVLDGTNNPPNRVALGFMQADITVNYFSIILQFVINLQAGQSVQVTALPPQLAA